jgi:uncharacterized protein YdeI (YjbR/CyaY-like superfamily)
MKNDLNPVFFPDPLHFRKWLEENHKQENELIVGFYKKHTDKFNMTWSQSVDEALCFGWIDGVRRSLGNESYCIRFTPRRSSSGWSNVNLRKVEELSKQGLMQPAGLEAYNSRKAEKSGLASYESEIKQLDDNFLGKFKAEKSAWDYFSTQAPSYQRTIIHWIMSAKQEQTRISRLDKAIKASEGMTHIY